MYCQRDIARVAVITPAATPALSVDDDVKPHLRIDHDAEDTKLLGYVDAAAGLINAPFGHLGRSLISQTLRLTLDGVPPTVIYLPGPPVTEVKKIEVRGSDDTFTTIYDSVAVIDTINLMSDLTAEPAMIWADDTIGWPSDIKGGIDSVRVEYVAGYDDANSIPKPIRQWLLTRVGEMYRDPEASVLGLTSTELKHAVRALDNWKVRR